MRVVSKNLLRAVDGEDGDEDGLAFLDRDGRDEAVGVVARADRRAEGDEVVFAGVADGG